MSDQCQIIGPDKVLKQLDPQEQKAGINVFAGCLATQKGEKILIVTDSGKLDIEAPIFFETAKLFTTDVSMAVMPAAGKHGEEPPRQISQLMREADIVLLVTTFSASHTLARHQACDNGARIASLPGITKDIILRTLQDSYTQVAHVSKTIAGALTAAERAQLTSPGGTDIVFSLSGRQAIADTGLIHNKRDFGNLPAGEAFLAPQEGKSQGKIVFDGAFADTFCDQPIKVTVDKGKVTKIEGGQGASQLELALNAIGENSRNIAELGVGTNKNCRLESSILEIEKVWGTCHIALGNNMHFGGEVDVQYHADGVILSPSLALDGKMIVENGQLKL